MEVQNPHYIYLLQEREFIKTGEDIYKVGKTTQENSKRFYQYPKGSKLLIQNICFNCNTIENIIIKEFKSKYKQRRDIGNEYFQGDCNDMINDIYNILIKQPRLPDVIIDENVKEEEHDQNFINNNEILSIIEKNKTEMLSIINNNKNEIIETLGLVGSLIIVLSYFLTLLFLHFVLCFVLLFLCFVLLFLCFVLLFLCFVL